ncbi:MAG: hypothetical protein ACI4NA_06955 [Succinivibrio sp.]
MTPEGKTALCLALALATAALFRVLVGRRRQAWFRRFTPKSPVSAKGAFGDALALGTPRTLKGAAAACALALACALEAAAVWLLL